MGSEVPIDISEPPWHRAPSSYPGSSADAKDEKSPVLSPHHALRTCCLVQLTNMLGTSRQIMLSSTGTMRKPVVAGALRLN